MLKTAITAMTSVTIVLGTQAQQLNLRGNWNCEATFSSQGPNQAPFGFVRTFQLSIETEGSVRFSGTEVTPAGSFPFSGEGEWLYISGHISITGKMRGGSAQIIAIRSGFPIPPGSEQFYFATTPQTNTYMVGEEQRGDKRSGIQRIATQCRR